jgi:hypothetical protein
MKKFKECLRCQESKEIKFFSVDKRRHDGLCCWCKSCASESWKKWYRDGGSVSHLKKPWMNGDKGKIKAYSEKRNRKYPIEVRAGRILRSAIKAGKIKRLPCEKCGNEKSQGHHQDYSKPLEVIWLCDLHHKKAHNRLVVPATIAIAEYVNGGRR